MPGTARIGWIETNGLLGAITIASAAAIASSTPGAGRARLGTVVDERVDLVLVPPGDEPLLEGERALGRDEVRAEPVVGRRQRAASRGPPRSSGRAVTADSGSPSRSACERTRWRPMSRSPSMNQPSPPQARADSSACQVSPARPQPRSVSFRPGEAVEDGVEVGRDVEAEHLEVVADVADDRQLARREHVVEPGRELGAADAAGEENDLHAVRAASTLC